MSSRLWQILAAYKELPSTSLFYKTTQQYARDQYVRVVHESNALESTGPESEAQTKTLGDDLAFFLLDYHREKLTQCLDDAKRIKKDILAIYQLEGEEFDKQAKALFMRHLAREQDETLAYLHAKGIDLSLPPKNPEVTQHIASFCNLIYFSKSMSIMSREYKAEATMREITLNYERIDEALLVIICFFHKVLMHNIHPDAGQWKSQQNNMGHGGPITYAPEAVKSGMKNWIKKLRELLDSVLNWTFSVWPLGPRTPF